VEKGIGAVFHWTTTLPMTRKDDTIVIQGRRGAVEITIPPGTEAIIEALPLMNPERRAIDELRREMVRFGLTHAETQPRLRITQLGREGTLRIAVRLIPRNS